MAKKSLGHIELRWTCPNCRGENLGSVRSCETCGAPQPEDVEFHKPARQELVTDAEKIAQAEAGADIHCPYCGTRNPAPATACKQCGGDLAEGKRRAAGRVVAAFEPGDAGQVTCPQCGTSNPDDRTRCSSCGASLRAGEAPTLEPAGSPEAVPKARRGRNRVLIIGMVVTAVLVCGALALFAILSGRTSAVSGTVQGVAWERSVSVEGLVPVESQDWRDQVPAGAELGACREEVRSVVDQAVQNAEEVCGTPYTVETGSGFAEVVQDCEYHVYDQLCTYTDLEWQTVSVFTERGQDLSPFWPQPSVGEDERLSDRQEESYACIFTTDQGTLTYHTSSLEEFQECRIGSTWDLQVNTFGQVLDIER